VATALLGDVLQRIRTGTYRTKVRAVRRHKATNQAAYKTAKEALLAFTPCCALHTRDKTVPWDQKLISTTGVVHYDFDHVPDPAALKRRLAENPATVFAFVSPGGDGLKIGVAVNGVTDPDTYKHAWAVVLKRLKRTFMDVTITEDEHVKCLHALCFVSDDPDIYINEAAVPLDIPPPPPPVETPLATTMDADYQSIASALPWIPAEDYHTWLTVGMALHGTGAPWARPLWDSWSMTSKKFSAQAQEAKWQSFHTAVQHPAHVGQIITLAYEHGWRRPDPPAEEIPPKQGKAPLPRPKAVRIKGSALLAKQLPPLLYVVDGILPAGCTLFTGKSKDGKSLMAYNLTVAVITGRKAFGVYDVQQGSVWYLALEDGERRAQQRLRMQEAQIGRLPDHLQDKIEFTLWEAPRLGAGLEEDIREWIEHTPDARLVVIDILEKVRPPRKGNGNLYADDYQATQSLTRLAQEKNVAILVVHHANKLNPVDFRDSASGTISLIGGADNFWSLHRLPLSQEGTLRITGRDIEEEQELAMVFKDAFWTIIDNGGVSQMSKERKAIFDVLRASPKPLTSKQIADRLGKPYDHTRFLVHKMLHAGSLTQPLDGYYTTTPSIPANTANTTNTANGARQGTSTVSKVDSFQQDVLQEVTDTQGNTPQRATQGEKSFQQDCLEGVADD